VIGLGTVLRALGAFHPQARFLEVECIEAQGRRLRHPKPVPVDHQQENVVADAVPPLLGRLKQALHLGVGQEVLAPNVGIDGPHSFQFDL